MTAIQSVRNRMFDFAIYVIITALTILMIYPFIYIIAVSLSDPKLTTGADVTFFPKGFTLDLYRYIFMLPTVGKAYLNSVIYTTLGTAISLALTVLCAYPLSKRWLFGRGFFTGFAVVTMFVGGDRALLVPLFLIVKALGMYNTMWSLIVPGALNTFLMLVALTFFRSLPPELEEAAYIDGASHFSILTRIYLPLSKPILATLALYYAVGYWNAWFNAAIFLNDASKYPIQLVLRNLMLGTGVGQQEMTAVFGDTLRSGGINIQALNYALIVAVILPIVFIYPFVQRYFVKGMLVGSLKG